MTLAGVVPDLDGLGAPVELLTTGSDRPLLWFSEYHHVLLHNVGGAIATAVLVLAAARQRAAALLLALATFHLHLLGDLAGGRGPDGYPWPIPYLLPFSDAWQLAWSGQWALNAWPNVALTIAALAATFRLAWSRGRSPLGLVSARADRAFVAALRQRFGAPRTAAAEPASR